MTRFIFICIALFCLNTTAHADWKKLADETWHDSKNLGRQALEETKQLGNKTLEKSKYYGNQAMDASKQWYAQLTAEDNPLLTIEQIEAENKQAFKQKWLDVLAQLDAGLDLHHKIEQAPSFSWFSKNKMDFSRDLIDVFQVIEDLLFNEAMGAHRDKIEQHQQAIAEQQQEIAKLKEQQIVANVSEQQAYQQKIQQAQQQIQKYKALIHIEKTNIKQRFLVAGVVLSDEQLTILLSRVDANDLIKLITVFDILKDITQQLMQLTANSNEDLQHARKYYGMHMMLLNFVLQLQSTYISHLTQTYLPKIKRILQQTQTLNQKSKQMLDDETDAGRKTIIEKNITAQDLTLKVAELYQQQLQHQQEKIQQAMDKITKDYQVAENTYNTVKINADLLALMQVGQQVFTALMQIQVPDIQPFENSQMQQKYQELSALIQ